MVPTGPATLPASVSCSVSGLKNTHPSRLELVVGKHFPLDSIDLELKHPSDKPVALLPTELLDQLSRYCEEILCPTRPELPSLYLYDLVAHAVPRLATSNSGIKTQQLVANRKAYKPTSCN